jgi:hypothetical protein
VLEAEYRELVLGHYEKVWQNSAVEKRWLRGPTWEISDRFSVLEFRPTSRRAPWTYATCGMSNPSSKQPLELHLFSPEATELHVELLTVIAHYHQTGARLGLAHTVNFGRPWLPGSRCSFGLLSLPYLDGPEVEWLPLGPDRRARMLWLIPVTPEEIALKKAEGLEALESRMEKAGFNYGDPLRASLA